MMYLYLLMGVCWCTVLNSGWVRCSRSRTWRLEGSVLVGMECSGMVGLVGKRQSLTLLVGCG